MNINYAPKYNYLFKGGPDCYICGKNSDDNRQSVIICTFPAMASLSEAASVRFARRIYTSAGTYVCIREIKDKSLISSNFEADTGACPEHKKNLEKLLALLLKGQVLDHSVIIESKRI